MAIQKQQSKLQFFIKPLSASTGIPRWMAIFPGRVWPDLVEEGKRIS
jgi:hypothetical protein